MSEFEIEEKYPKIADKSVKRICGDCYFYRSVVDNSESGFGTCRNWLDEDKERACSFVEKESDGCYYHRTLAEIKDLQKRSIHVKNAAETMLEKLKEVRQYLPAIVRSEVDKLIEETEK